jgi:chromosomal replication initiator protein
MASIKTQTTFRIDPKLLRTFQHALLDHGKKMTPVIETLIRNWISENGRAIGEPNTQAQTSKPKSVSNQELLGPPAVAAQNANPWLRILTALEGKITRHSYDTWFKPTRFSHVSGDTIFVLVPTPEFRDIKNEFGDLLEETLSLTPPYQDIKFITAEENSTAIAFPTNGKTETTAAKSHRFDWDASAQLSPKYTFDAFVVGAGNQFAHAAASAVAERPSKAYNPLFLYGGVGMGKTHLMQAIGHEVKRRQPLASICYISSEKFTNEMINSLRYDKMGSFRDKFRNVDVLLVDDIQFFAQKERTQEEFFHTFNALHNSMKQIVIASDRPPKELDQIEARLRSRFEWGLIADIQPPDHETKVAILMKKAESERVFINPDLALYIASNVRTNVRELEGALIRLVAYCSLTGAEFNLITAQQVLRNFIDPQARKITIDSIQKAVAEQFGLRLVEIKAKNNSRAIVFPRQIAMYLAKELTDASLPEIGRQFGGKHHTTVSHSIDKIAKQKLTDRDLNRLVNKLAETLNN